MSQWQVKISYLTICFLIYFSVSCQKNQTDGIANRPNSENIKNLDRCEQQKSQNSSPLAESYFNHLSSKPSQCSNSASGTCMSKVGIKNLVQNDNSHPVIAILDSGMWLASLTTFNNRVQARYKIYSDSDFENPVKIDNSTFDIPTDILEIFNDVIMPHYINFVVSDLYKKFYDLWQSRFLNWYKDFAKQNDGSFGHGGPTFGTIAALTTNDNTDFVLLTASMNSILCYVNQIKSNSSQIPHYLQVLSSSLRKVIRDHNIRYLNWSGGYTVESLKITFNQTTCAKEQEANGSTPTDNDFSLFLKMYGEYVLKDLENEKDLLIIQSNTNPGHEPDLLEKMSLNNRFLVSDAFIEISSIESYSKSIPLKGSIFTENIKQGNNSKSYQNLTDIYINYPTNNNPLESEQWSESQPQWFKYFTSPTGLNFEIHVNMSTSFAAPPATAMLVHLRESAAYKAMTAAQFKNEFKKSFGKFFDPGFYNLFSFNPQSELCELKSER